MQSVHWKSAWQWLVLAIIVIACSWPLFNSQMFFTHDFVHGVRIAEMARALKDGHFPVRWTSNFAYGYGMPLFEFYAPLPFYLGSLLYFVGIPLVLCVKLLFLLANVLTAAGSYLLGRKLGGKWGGLLAAALITLAPYRGLNLSIRGAVSETWGILALVWILYATLLVLEKKKYSPILLVISLITLFLSHNLTVIIAAPFIAVWTISWMYWSSLKEITNGTKFLWSSFFESMWVLAVSYLVAFGVASFYLLPLFVEKDFTKVEAATTGGYFSYQLHFLYIRQLFRTVWGYGGSEWGPDDKLPFFLGFGQYLGLLVGGVVLMIGLLRLKLSLNLKNAWLASKTELEKRRQWWILLTSLMLVAASLFMALGKSQFIWDALEFMKFIQFPWRYYSVLSVFIGIVGALSLWFLPRKLLPFLVGVVLLVTIGLNWQYFRPEKYLEESSLLYYDDPSRVQTHMSEILPDYIPKQLAEKIAPPKSLVTCGNELDKNLEACSSVNVTTDKTQRKVFTIEIPETELMQVVTVSIANYPGWKASVDGIAQTVGTSKEGLIELALPAGKHEVAVSFGSTGIRQLADTVSLISSIIFIIWIFKLRTKHD